MARVEPGTARRGCGCGQARWGDRAQPWKPVRVNPLATVAVVFLADCQSSQMAKTHISTIAIAKHGMDAKMKDSRASDRLT